MARVKVCEVCESENAPDEVFCVNEAAGRACGVSLADVLVTESGARTQRPSEPPPQPAGTFREAPRMRPSLVFSWGSEPVDGRLAVGREEGFSPLAARLATYDMVSGRHAEFYVTDGALFVRHIGRTNPTYVDGRPLQIGESAQLADGAAVAFSRSLVATIKLV
jgi:hypothetical protein